MLQCNAVCFQLTVQIQYGCDGQVFTYFWPYSVYFTHVLCDYSIGQDRIFRAPFYSTDHLKPQMQQELSLHLLHTYSKLAVYDLSAYPVRYHINFWSSNVSCVVITCIGIIQTLLIITLQLVIILIA